MDTSKLRIGDKVKVVSVKYFNSRVRVGDMFIVVGFLQDNENSPILQNKYFSRQYTWLPDGEVEKIEIEPYVEPEYIKNVRNRVRKLSYLHKFYKYKYKRRDNLSSERKALVISKYFETSKELNDLYTILRQHNEMKRMFAKMRG